MKHLRIAAMALAVAGLLAGCGGGSTTGDVPQPPHEVPDSAMASPAAYTQFAGSLVQSDSAGPLDLGRVKLAPTSETDLPLKL